MKICLYEKVIISALFKEVSKKFGLNTEVIQKDIFPIQNIETER